ISPASAADVMRSCYPDGIRPIVVIVTCAPELALFRMLSRTARDGRPLFRHLTKVQLREVFVAGEAQLAWIERVAYLAEFQVKHVDGAGDLKESASAVCHLIPSAEDDL